MTSYPTEISVPTGTPGQSYKLNAYQNTDGSITFQHIPVVNDDIVSNGNPMPTADSVVAAAIGTPSDPTYAGGNGTVISILKGIFGIQGGSGGTISIGSVSLEAGSAVIGAVQQAGNWILSAGNALIGGVNIVDATGTNRAIVSSAGAVKVDGSAVTQPVSGTVSLDNTDATNIATVANAMGVAGSGDGPPTGGNGLLGYSSGQFTILTELLNLLTSGITVNGTFFQSVQPISGIVTANLGTTDTGNLATVATKTTATAAVLGTTADVTWNGTGTATVVSVLKAIFGQLTSSVTVSGTFWQSVQPISGTITANLGSTDSGNLSSTASALGNMSDAAWSSGNGSVISLLKTIANNGSGGGGTISGTVSLDSTDSTNISTTATKTTSLVTSVGSISDVAWLSGSGSAISVLKAIANAVMNPITVTGTFFQAVQPVSLDSTDSTNISNVSTNTLASANALGTVSDTAWSSGNGTTIALLKALVSSLRGTISVSGTFFQSVQPVSGTVTANLDTTDAGNIAATASALGTTADAEWTSGSGSVIALLKAIASGTTGTITGTVSLDSTDSGYLSTTATKSTAIASAVGTTTDTAWVSGSGTVVSLLKALVGIFTNPVTVTGTFFQSIQPVSGSVTATLDGTDAGNVAATATALGAPSDTTWTSGSGTVISLLKTIAGGTGGAISGTVALDTTDSNNLSTTASQTTATASALGTTADSPWSSGAGTVVSILKAIATTLTGTISVSGTFWQATQPVSLTSLPSIPTGSNTIGGVKLIDAAGTNEATIGASGALKVDGSSVTQPISGTVTANLDTTDSGYLSTIATQSTTSASETTTIASNTSAIGTTADSAWSSGNGTLVSLLKAVVGKLSSSISVTGTFWQSVQPVSISATVNVSTTTSGSATGGTAASNSDLIGLLYTTTAPTLTNGQQSALRGDASSNLMVNVATGSVIATLDSTDSTNLSTIATKSTASASALGTTSDSTWVSGNGTTISLLKAIASTLAGTITVTGTFWQSVQPISGTVTANLNSTDSGNLATVATETTDISTSLGSTTDAIWSSGSGTAISLLKAIASGITGTVNLDTTDSNNLSTVATKTTATANALGTVSDSAWSSGNGTTISLLKAISGFLSGTITVSGTFWQSTQPVSISGTISTSNSSLGSVAPGTAATSSGLIGLVYNTTTPSLSNGQQVAAQSDSAGNLLVNVSTGTVSLGTTDSNHLSTVATQSTSSASALGTTADSAWASGTGSVIALLKTIANQTAAISGTVSLDTSDSTHISTTATETTAIAAATGTTSDSSWTSGNGTTISLLKAIVNLLTGGISVTGVFWQSVQPVSISATVNTQDASDGSVSAGTAATKSSLAGLVYNSTVPTVTNGQQISLQGDSSGRLLVNVVTGTITANLGSTDSGNLASVVTETTAVASATGTTADTAWSSGNGTVVSLLKAVIGKLSGNLLVTGTFWQSTQPVSIASVVSTSDAANGSVAGGTAASVSGLIGTVYNTTLPTLTNGQQAAVQSDSSGRIYVNVATGNITASLGTTDSSNLASVVTETTATAAALGSTSDSAWSSGNGSVVSLLKNVANKLSGSIAVTGVFWQATQPVSISSTVNTSDAANGSVSGGTAGSKSELAGLIYNSSAISLSTGQQASLQGDSSGRLLVNVAAGSVTATLDGTDSTNISTTATETTTIASNTTAIGTTADAAWSSGNGTLVALLKNIATKLAGSISVTGTFWQATQPVSIAATVNTSDAANGSASGGTAASVSELVGAVYHTTLPTLTNGQQSAIQADSSGRILVNVATGSITATLDSTDSNNISATASALGTTADTSWTSGNGTVIALLKAIINKLNGSVAVTGTFWQSVQPVSGTVTANLGTTDTANLSTVATETTAIAGAAGTTADTAYAGSGNSTIVAGIKGLYAILNSIYTKLSASIAVTGSVTATLDGTDSGYLSTISTESTAAAGALGTTSDSAWTSGAGSMIALLKTIASNVTGGGSITNNSTSWTANATLATTIGSYTSNMCIGGVQSISSSLGSLGGTIKNVTAIIPNPSSGSPDLFIVLMYANPSHSTFTDNTGITISSSDYATCVAGIWPLTTTVSSTSGIPIVAQAQIDLPVTTTVLYYAIGSSSAFTLTTSAAVVQFSGLK